MNQTLLDPEAARVAIVSRVMNVPARYLFLAHSKPEHLKRWFGPVGYPVTFCEIDFRVGGKWRMAMTGPDGVQGPFFGGTYREITPTTRIVYDDAFEDGVGGEMNLKNAHTAMTFTITFDEAQGKTTLTVSVQFATVAMKEEFLGVGMLEGIGSSLDQLTDLAAELARLG